MSCCAAGRPIGDVDTIRENSFEATRDEGRPWLLAPCDLQAVKASGVTFVVSLLERVIEEVERRGWPYRRSRPELSSKYIFVKDPNGYDVEILERRP